MNQKKSLVIINKEKIFQKNGCFYCDNIDMKTIPEELGKNFELCVIAAKSKKERSLLINFRNIKTASNIFNFLSSIFKTFKNKNTNYLLISITPYNFFAYLFLLICKKNIFIYLRSNGYEEYKSILGFWGSIIYHFMFVVVTSKSKIISCQERLVKKKVNYNLVFPSELNNLWFEKNKEPMLDKARILYVGRVKVEKGIFSLLNILNELKYNFSLSIAGKDEKNQIKNKDVNLLGFKKDVSSLIDAYDNHNITILPSYTEAHPKVIDESLARVRPIIIFEEINHVIQNKYGIFVCKRNSDSLLKVIKFIMENYKDIQNKIKKNKLPKKENFISDLIKILN
tara:strand:+ start:711 stop:1730 length:1020 start_codon:yes stop_codon:yes gene_type:complete